MHAPLEPPLTEPLRDLGKFEMLVGLAMIKLSNIGVVVATLATLILTFLIMEKVGNIVPEYLVDGIRGINISTSRQKAICCKKEYIFLAL